MDTLLARDLEILLAERQGPCVSLYMPTFRTGNEMRQGIVRLRNLLHQAEERLREKGVPAREVEPLLAPAEGLLDDSLFWRGQGEGLALFCAPGFFRVFRLAHPFEERVQVGEHFFLKPLLPLVEPEGVFYVLALSQNEVRFLKATHRTVRRLTPLDLPHSLVDALGWKRSQQMLGYHTASPAGPGARIPTYHGRGGGEEGVKAELQRFLLRVEAAVSELLAGSTAPLVLAGADPLPALYRTVSAYPHLIGESIAGNPEILKDEELRDRAWSLAAPQFETARRQAEERWEELAGTRRTSSDPVEILHAAQEGRVEVLFLDGSSDLWGRFDGRDGVQIHPQPESDDEELLDAAALLSLRKGGSVYAMDRGRVPGGGELAAVFRY